MRAIAPGWSALAVLASLMMASESSAQENPAAPPAPDLRGTELIHVRDASYGHSGALADCTVTEAVKRQCEGRMHCVLDVTDQLCPPPQQVPGGLILTLTVRYRCEAAGPSHFKTADKPFSLTIECAPGKL